jgi:galactoside O-acetyltransferase
MNKYDIPNVITFEFTKIIGVENIKFGDFVIIDDFVLIYAKKRIEIGDYVHIASYSSISGGGELVMEEFSGISSGCRIITGSDDFTGRGFGNPTIADNFRNHHVGKVHISRFSIIGANSVILPDVTIGEGASIAAGSVVSKDLEPWGIFVGNRKVGERNKEDVLKSYDEFLTIPEHERVGSLFK